MPAPRKHPRSFDEEAARAGISSRIAIGVRPIRVKRIVGSAGKAGTLDADFRPLGHGPAQGHYTTIYRLMKAGTVFPEITVYQIGNRYFVIDGHTRVAAARAAGIEFIDANVTECLPRKEGDVNLTFYARREFERDTGLEGVRLTAPWRYHLLHRHVEGYRLYLERSTDRDVSLTEAARIWYRSQYSPTLMEIRRRRLTSTGGGRTAGDVYTDILKAWAEREGLVVSLREMLDQYDRQTRGARSTLQRAKRVVTDVMDASLPKVIPQLTKPTPADFAKTDVEAELAEDSPSS
ncbi:MAG: hypothetical protein ACR2JC_08985 [Chloroflexota bacterium]|nr:MAG: hypothetical protein DLM70_03035 [Chloroflexota bacterium]